LVRRIEQQIEYTHLKRPLENLGTAKRAISNMMDAETSAFIDNYMEDLARMGNVKPESFDSVINV
jgi:hypothetical protein